MINCIGSPADECLESYLQGTLSEAQAQQFEEHYFDCPVCLAQVEALQAVREQLASQPVADVPQPGRRVISWPLRLSAVGALAALLLLTFIGLHGRRPAPQVAVATAPAAATPQPEQQKSTAPAETPKSSLAGAAVSRLADLTLPVFRASNLRGQSRNPQFDTGMQAYADQDCAGAVRSLQQVPAQDEDALAAQFYRGVCQMHLGEMAAAAKTLGAVAQAGDSAQQEAAYYYLGQIALAANDVPTARFNLAHCFQLRGEFEARARAELVKLRQADGSASH
jgi:hypothetical protein